MRLFCLSLLIVFVFSCSNTKKKQSNLLGFTPKNTSIIIKTSNLESLTSSINNSDFLQRLYATTTYSDIAKKLKPLSYLNPSEDVLIFFSKDENKALEYSIATRISKDLFITDSIPDYTEEELTNKTKSFLKSNINDATVYSTIIDSTFFASSSKTIMVDAFTNNNQDEALKKIYNTTGADKTFSVVLKPDSDFVSLFFINDSILPNSFTEYLAIDAELTQNNISFNGITTATDSTESLINIFKNTIPQVNQVQNITPSNSDGFMSFTFDNFKTLENQLLKFNKKDSIAKNTTLFNDVFEVGVIYEANNRAIVLNSKDIIATNDALLSEQTKLDNYRGIALYAFSTPDLFNQTFTPLITDSPASMYCILDHFFVFANNLDILQNIIANYQNKTTLSSTSYFKDAQAQLSDASSLLQVTNAATLQSIIKANISADNNIDLKRYNTSAIQFIYDTNFAHINGIIKKNKSRASLHSVSEELNIKLDKALLSPPQFVKNHITKQKEIVVQDINNNLYLISNKGKILWKKQLKSAILGKIEQIDIYKNGRLQLVFVTQNKLYVLDRNGKEVKPFPLKFKDDITQPLAVFDYDKRKKYRFLVTQGKDVLMYDSKGKTVKGFAFKSAKNTIISQPKHLRIGTKDYITLKTKNKLYILDRLGKTRVTPKQSFSYSDQDVFLYNNTFTSTTSSGDLVSIDRKGHITSQNLNLAENHHLETTSKTLVTLSENKLVIKNKTTELDFGDYSNPRIFYVNNKIYVSVTDLQSHKIYLFDSQSKLLPNFPVYGNSAIELDNIDKDKNLEFVTQGENNAIILYQIN